MIQYISRKKLRNNTENAPLGIQGADTEHKKNLRVKSVVEREILFLLEIDWYYCEQVDTVL